MRIAHRLRKYYSVFTAKGSNRPYQQSSFLARSFSRKRILLFTDSRGINIPGHFNYRHYSTRLLQRYDVEAYLCPEKWTTLLDFLQLWKTKKTETFDYVILHVGIVDASPRHQGVAISNIYSDKKSIFDEIFGEQVINDHLHADLMCDYEGERTVNMYSIEMAERYLIPQLQEIDNLIWIGTNKIDDTWRGNYWNDRPANISLVEGYSRLFAGKLSKVVDLLDLWSLEDVRKYTFDNIHPNKNGSDIIYDHIIRLLDEETQKQRERPKHPNVRS
ncbi:MAG: SGNH/GDSL hydrolase family protein [Rhodocyclales bacterium]|nr:SGNH/GDSL hydrolase family protein [Rhodocyclales bacterium]